jgi:hypothetical protein
MAEIINIDVVTLDSVQCAACGFMMEAIAALPDDIQEVIDYTEWSIKHQSGLNKFMELEVKVLPSICIEGEPVFESKIPQFEELIDAMAERAPSESLKEKILAIRDQGFQFDKIQENLERAGAGKFTRRDSKIEK